MKFYFFLGVTWLMLCCEVSAENLDIVSGAISVNGSTMRIEGTITPKLASEFREALTSEIKTIEVNSGGGLASAGLEMGTLMLGKGLTLIVDGKCMSGCASTLFLAAEKKILRPNAVIGWHGGAIASLNTILYFVERAIAHGVDVERSLEASKQLQEEVQFCAKIGVSLDFLYYSGLVTQMRNKGHSKSVQVTIDGKIYESFNDADREIDFWSPDINELSKYGIANVSLMPSDAKEKRSKKAYRYFGGNKIYLGKAYSYFPEIVRKKKYPLRFDWKKFHELELKATQLAEKYAVSTEAIDASQEKSADQLHVQAK